MAIIEIKHLYKSFGDIQVFNDFSCNIEPSGLTVIAGPSGSGKSTLLNIIGLLDRHDKGSVTWWGEDNVKPYTRKAEKILQNKLGYIFQNFALIEDQTVDYNLSISLDQLNMSRSQKQAAKQNSLASVGLDGFLNKKVFECSGGEQQRIAVARLLLKPCELILADEPTGSLDEENRDMILKLLFDLMEQGKTLLISTHDPYIIDRADNLIKLEKRMSESGPI